MHRKHIVCIIIGTAESFLFLNYVISITEIYLINNTIIKYRKGDFSTWIQLRQGLMQDRYPKDQTIWIVLINKGRCMNLDDLMICTLIASPIMVIILKSLHVYNIYSYFLLWAFQFLTSTLLKPINCNPK